MILALALAFQVKATQIAPPDLAAKADQPQIAVAPGGEVYVAFGAADRIYVSKSTDDGYTFGAPVALPVPTEPAFEDGAIPRKMALGMRRGPRIAASKGRVVVTAMMGAQGGGKDGDLLAWRSDDDGKTWKGPSTVNDVPGSAREGLHCLAANSQGNFVAAWLDMRGNGTELVSNYSTNGGRSWSKDNRVYASPDGSICECCHPSIAFGPYGECALIFRNSVRGVRDMHLVASPDLGWSWNRQALKLGTMSWEIGSCPMDGGMVAFDNGGGVSSVWRSGDKLFFARGTNAVELGPGRNPWMAWSETGPVFVWEVSRGGALYLQNGTSATNRTRLTENGTDPVVATTKSATIAAWRGVGSNPGVFVVRI